MPEQEQKKAKPLPMWDVVMLLPIVFLYALARHI